MDKIFVKPKAKINLTLNILNTRPDGYHDLESVFETVYLYDEMQIFKTTEEGIKINCNKESLTKDNILIKAYNKLKEEYSQITGVIINLNKKIPTESGLGGASADCAAFLVSMNKLFDLNIAKEKLMQMGASLGADVVPCMVQNTMIGRGIGEKVEEIENKAQYYIILIKPDVSCSTKEMFKKYDSMKGIKQKYNTKKIVQALQENNIELLGSNLYNVFEDTIKEERIIFECKEALLNLGASSSLMTGSGSCVFGIFDDKKRAKLAYKKLKTNHETYYSIPYRRR